jgi:uncharacterized protein YqkB
MVNYDYLNKSKELDILIKIGVVPIHIMDWMQIYKFFLDEMKLQNNQKMVCYESTAEYFKLTSKSIQNIKNFMEKEISNKKLK